MFHARVWFAVAVAVCSCGISGVLCEADWELALDEEFNTFDLSLWKHDITLAGGGNWEFQAYSNNRSNSYVKDGVLYLHPTLLADDIGADGVTTPGTTLDYWGGTPADLCTAPNFYGCFRESGGGGNFLNPIKSAAVRTAESFTFKYGRVEVKARLPQGDWLWPAIWMLPRWNNYGQWPASGEIDIMESRGNAPSYPPGGYDMFGSTLHWGPGWTDNAFHLTHEVLKPNVDLTADFHTYGLIWTETYIGTYFDTESRPVLNFSIDESFWDLGGWARNPHWKNPWQYGGKNAPFDQEFYLVINLACGGLTGYFPDGNGKPWSNTGAHPVNDFWNSKTQWYPTWKKPFAIDSVKVWTTKKKNK
jgi:hypothetical protein